MAARRRAQRPQPATEPEDQGPSLLTRDGALARLQGGAIGRVRKIVADWAWEPRGGLRCVEIVLPGPEGTEFDQRGTCTKPEHWWLERLEAQSPVTEQELAQIHALVLENRIRVLKHLIDSSQAELEAYERELQVTRQNDGATKLLS